MRFAMWALLKKARERWVAASPLAAAEAADVGVNAAWLPAGLEAAPPPPPMLGATIDESAASRMRVDVRRVSPPPRVRREGGLPDTSDAAGDVGLATAPAEAEGAEPAPAAAAGSAPAAAASENALRLLSDRTRPLGAPGARGVGAPAAPLLLSTMGLE